MIGENPDRRGGAGTKELKTFYPGNWFSGLISLCLADFIFCLSDHRVVHLRLHHRYVHAKMAEIQIVEIKDKYNVDKYVYGHVDCE